jgi:hypothetical protein
MAAAARIDPRDPEGLEIVRQVRAAMADDQSLDERRAA